MTQEISRRDARRALNKLKEDLESAGDVNHLNITAMMDMMTILLVFMLKQFAAEQALIALREAEAYPGPSLVLAYSHCIAHGFDLRDGMKQQARATAEQAIALAEAGYHAVAPDMRGFGKTTRPTRIEDYALETLGDDVAALVDALGETKAHVLGHEWGGLVAAEAALSHPDKVDRLIVDERNLYHQIRKYLKKVSPELLDRVRGRGATSLHDAMHAVRKVAETGESLSQKVQDEVQGYIAVSRSVREDLEKAVQQVKLKLADLDALPFPRWDLLGESSRLPGLDIPLVMRPLHGGFPSLASRSCPEFCTYCPIRILASHRVRSVGNIVDEIEQLCDRYERPHVIFRDPLFSQDRDRCVAISDEILVLRVDDHEAARLRHLLHRELDPPEVEPVRVALRMGR